MDELRSFGRSVRRRPPFSHRGLPRWRQHHYNHLQPPTVAAPPLTLRAPPPQEFDVPHPFPQKLKGGRAEDVADPNSHNDDDTMIQALIRTTNVEPPKPTAAKSRPADPPSGARVEARDAAREDAEDDCSLKWLVDDKPKHNKFYYRVRMIPNGVDV